jgi:hypothetical protein
VTHPRFEMLAFADHDCEQQVAASWHDTLLSARSALDEAFVMGMTTFGCVRDHERGFFPIRRCAG